MPIQSFTSTEAGRNVRRNPVGMWPDGRRRGQRLEGIADIKPQPSFTIEPDDKLMTIGSCFAREIEKALAARGFDLPTTALVLPAEERASATANDILNKYTIHSMANEIEWAFEEPDMAPEDLFVTAGDGLWHDPHLVANMDPVTLERAIERRGQVLDIMRRLPECRVIVVTLGLAEAWFDTKLGIYLNVMPPQAAISAEPDRFRLDVLSYEDITEGIERFLSLLAKHGRPDHKVIMTVSPVPFKATFTGGDALSANTYSKAVQRAAAGAAALRHDNVDYFPSYEIVTLTDRKVAFTIDNIHVNREVVAEIMRLAVKHYVPALEVEEASEEQPATEASRDPFNPSAILGQGYSALEAKDYAQAANQFSALLFRYHDRKPALLRDAYTGLIRTLLAANRAKEARQTAERWLEEDPGHGAAEAMLSKVFERARNAEKALYWAVRATEQQPENGIYFQRLAVLERRNGNPEAARSAATRAVELMPELDVARQILEEVEPI